MKCRFNSIAKRAYLISTILLFSWLCNNELLAQGRQDKERILQLAKQFQECIIKKDSIQFIQLFLHDSIPWIGVSGSNSWDFHKKRCPDVKQLEKGSIKGFIQYVVNYTGKIEEKVFNISIQSDEVMATMTFDYSFWKDQLPANWGKESWILLKLNGQWKIAAVYYSGFTQEVEPTLLQLF